VFLGEPRDIRWLVCLLLSITGIVDLNLVFRRDKAEFCCYGVGYSPTLFFFENNKQEVGRHFLARPADHQY